VNKLLSLLLKTCASAKDREEINQSLADGNCKQWTPADFKARRKRQLIGGLIFFCGAVLFLFSIVGISRLAGCETRPRHHVFPGVTGEPNNFKTDKE
jgi:hypothetical protein